MYRTLIFSLCLILFSVSLAVAEEKEPGANEPNEPVASQAKTLRGMSVLGNDDAPMSLFIVPWKSSQLGVEANLSRTLNERDAPVDREVFMRELDFYRVSVGKTN